jgi:hypothetical protein
MPRTQTDKGENMYGEAIHRLVMNYITDIEYIGDRISNSIKAHKRRGEKNYFCKINVPMVEECYIVSNDGGEGATVIVRYGERYCFVMKFYNSECDEALNVFVITKHFLEQYRVRNNMCANSNKELLCSIYTALNQSISTHTDRFNSAFRLNGNCVAPAEIYKYNLDNNNFIIATVLITYLNEQDTKVIKFNETADNVKTIMDKIWPEII